MAIIRLNTDKITDWASFHQVFKEAFGFPDFYGANMDAWIDCMSCLTANDGMTEFVLSKSELLLLEITNTEDFNLRLPEILDKLIECSAFVNNRYVETEQSAKIALVFL